MLGRKVINLKDVESTNSYAQKLAQADYPEGTVVFSEKQTKGRGRQGRSWLSLEGKGLYMSAILRPPFDAQEAQILTPLSAAAVCMALRNLGFKAMVKWPNDIYISGKKVSGILTETTLSANKIAYAVVGIGINLNHTKKDFPLELQQKSTSLRMEKGFPAKRRQVADKLIFNFNMLYDELIKSGHINSSIKICNEYSFLKGKIVTIKNQGCTITGLARKINSNGSLSIKKKDGEIKEVVSGELNKTISSI
ncbi:biotin--[acetyl-CoA-carboxylase] ligase [Proteinivorax tanatarense]|uniref:Biotin--[acetyl-CoA-carboxylase] ligase n=1 Tax=Proteinivorax tanatarense TaxID=1260629 RepID=A0AAU7VJ90_9FIRM